MLARREVQAEEIDLDWALARGYFDALYFRLAQRRHRPGRAADAQPADPRHRRFRRTVQRRVQLHQTATGGKPERTVTVTTRTDDDIPRQPVRCGVVFNLTGGWVQAVDPAAGAKIQPPPAVFRDRMDLIAGQPVGAVVAKEAG